MKYQSLYLLSILIHFGCFAQIVPKVTLNSAANTEIQKIISLLGGTWNIIQNVEPTEKIPKVVVGRGIETWRSGPGELSVIEEVDLKDSIGELSLMAVSWWDEGAKGIRSLVCRNIYGCRIETELGKWENDQLVFQSKFQRNGKQFFYKEVWSDFTKTSFKQRTYIGEVGQDLKLAATIVGTR